jgi:ATP-dependent Lon protease
MIGHGINDFYNVQDAVPDADGLIEAVLIPLIDLVVFPNMVTPLVVRREQDIAAIGDAQIHQETVLGVTQRNPSVSAPEPDDLHRFGTEMALGRLMHMPDGETSVLAQGRRRVEIVDFIQTQPYYRVKARPVLNSTRSFPTKPTSMR